VEISRKNKAKVDQKIKMFIKKLKDENEELEGSITQLKSQDEKLYDLDKRLKSKKPQKENGQMHYCFISNNKRFWVAK
jgi:uncharacterized protein (DUF3084 family)